MAGVKTRGLILARTQTMMVVRMMMVKVAVEIIDKTIKTARRPLAAFICVNLDLD
jgi:hypothetical protein